MKYAAFPWQANSDRIVIVDLEQQTTFFGFEWSVVYAGRTAGVGVGLKAGAIPSVLIIAHDQVARNQVNLLPIVMYKGPGRENAGLETQEPSTRATPGLFIEFSGKNFLFDTAGITRWSYPSVGHVE
jgi:hypothetical protein